ncbi:hypothetical protein [Parabacteroides johnsonii]|uniref:hypothetical protein n=1 Tax=Parabacteroides johnsonii TaxID=387661 RepID=UPI0011DDFEFD|nr:hypothetical protein [Parabacteroides johnsonii]MBP3641865.1 hypothetical protein [Parabacteroides sp.]
MTNKATGVPLAGKGTPTDPAGTNQPSFALNEKESKEDPANNLYAYFKTAWDNADEPISCDITITDENQGNRLFLAWPQNGNSGLIMDEPASGQSTGSIRFGKPNTGDKVGILLATAEEREVDLVFELNDIQGGEGFQFSFKDGDKVLKNIFLNKDLRAFNVKEMSRGRDGKDAEDGMFKIPGGIYLATEWSGLSETTLKNNYISSWEEFQKVTFVAALPQSYIDLTNTSRGNGHGFALGEVKGANMNFYAIKSTDDEYEPNQASSHDEVFVGNACFTIKVEDPLNLNDKYKLSLQNVRLATNKDYTDNHYYVTNDVLIGITNNTNNDDDEVAKNTYLVTNGAPITVTAVPSSSQADAKTLLNEGAVPVPALHTGIYRWQG